MKPKKAALRPFSFLKGKFSLFLNDDKLDIHRDRLDEKISCLNNYFIADYSYGYFIFLFGLIKNKRGRSPW
ncbi:hypothetical protein R6Y99_06490 [Pseudomonas lundensis]|uniref:hypothetical protein n=1 Tax=Serratia proteamaculans TaxID=28151 RepID=UPI0029827003|nr:hypothetical protein [Serratia proteamaculans]MDW5499438.1 hypothetical protein [Serratia proteamaculans]MDW5504500.1 hypothetical protein [Pseudomonas lundensis]